VAYLPGGLHGKSGGKNASPWLMASRLHKEDMMGFFMSLAEKFPAIKVCLIIVWLLAWVGTGLAGDPGPLPARDWNRHNLERITAPAGNPLTFAVLGDSRSNPPVFRQILGQMDRSPGLAFAIIVGDLVETGSAENFREFLKLVRHNLRLPLLTVLGNHDLEKDQGPRLYRAIFGPDYYAFHLLDHYFIVVNDAEPHGLGEPQWLWLEEELKKSRAYKTRLVFLHVPLFDPRGGEKRHCLPETTGRRLAALLRQYGVTHIFAGHIHSYFSGHWDGVPYTITGGAGAPLYGTDPDHYFYHYLKVTLRGGEVHTEVHRLKAEGD
jgi:predicted phosphodiesterase